LVYQKSCPVKNLGTFYKDRVRLGFGPLPSNWSMLRLARCLASTNEAIMNDNVEKQQIRQRMEEKTTEELVEIWKQYDRAEWREEAFDVL
jgi:hypothetical protein